MKAPRLISLGAAIALVLLPSLWASAQTTPVPPNLSLSLGGRASSVNLYEGMRYRDYKNLYDRQYYQKQDGDPYNPFLCGLASFFIPGLGQAVESEWGRAAGFFGGSLVSTTIGTACSGLAFLELQKRDVAPSDARVVGLLCTGLLFNALALGIDIWSTCDAYKIAKIKDMYEQDMDWVRNNGQTYSPVATIQPWVGPVQGYGPSGPQGLVGGAGLALKVRF